MIETVQKIDTTLATGKNQGLDIAKIRQDFPMLQQKVAGKPLIYFDSAASNHKPKAMTDRLLEFYTKQYGKLNEEHTFAKMATEAYDATRKKVANWINAKSEKEIVFVKSATEGINVVALAFERGILKADDEILITALEHHANIVPWQIACQQTGAKLIVAPINETGDLEMDKFEKLITDKTKIISVSHSSNVLGTILPIKAIVKLARKQNIPVMVDGAQMAPHSPLDMQDLGCDFYTFSGHKMGSASGVGILYGKTEWLEKLHPHHGGSEMAQKVTFEKTDYKSDFQKFEAGTSAFAEIIAFGSLVDYIQELGTQKLADYEQELLTYATEKLRTFENLKIIGTSEEKEPVISFYIEGQDMKKLEKYLNDEANIAVRAGKLSAETLLSYLNVPVLLRVSLCYFNTREEIDTLVKVMQDFLKK